MKLLTNKQKESYELIYSYYLFNHKSKCKNGHEDKKCETFLFIESQTQVYN